MREKYTFQDFLASVDGENQKFVSEVHNELTGLGCKAEVKAARSGYVVSYSLNKRTLANYVFRKKGLMARIYAGHIAQYMELLELLPDSMVRAIQAAPICKRLADPAAWLAALVPIVPYYFYKISRISRKETHGGRITADVI